jgi:hypothetical protein
MCHTKYELECSYEVMKLKIEVCYILKSVKGSNKPICHKKYLDCWFSCLSKVWFNFGWGGNTESKDIFKLQKKVISGVRKQVSCWQIFRDLNILPVVCI